MTVKHVMIDLETMGTAADSAILSIGAVEFFPFAKPDEPSPPPLTGATSQNGMWYSTTPPEPGLGASFYLRVSLRDNLKCGRTIDADTVGWWLGQNEAARKEMEISCLDNHGAHIVFPLKQALAAFASYLGVIEAGPDIDLGPNVRIWGNGAAFDNALLADAYHCTEMQQPWKFWNDRCYRTLKTLAPFVPPPPRTGMHDALEDAKHQARHACAIIRALNITDL